MRGIDVVGADEAGLIDAAASAAKGLVKYFKPDAAAQAPASTPAVTPQPKKIEDEGFLSKTIVAPVKVWHALLGAAVAGGGALWFWRK